MNFERSNLVFQCFRAHLDICFSNLVIRDSFVSDLFHNNIIDESEAAALYAKPSHLTHNSDRVIFLLQLLRTNLNLIKFLNYLRTKPDSPDTDHYYVAHRVSSTIAKFADLVQFLPAENN